MFKCKLLGYLQAKLKVIKIYCQIIFYKIRSLIPPDLNEIILSFIRRGFFWKIT